MVTEISGVGLIKSVVSQVSATSVQSATALTHPEAVIKPDKNIEREERTSTSSQLAGSFAQLRSGQDSLNKAASVIRDVGDTVEKVGQLLDQIENNLGKIVKMYPPYPIDSPERVSLLNDLGGLRKQIDALTFPPPESAEEIGQLLGTHKGVETKVVEASVSPDLVKAAKDHLNDIPILDPSNASDTEVRNVLDQIDAFKSSLDDIKSKLWEDVVRFVKQAESPESKNEATGLREQLADLGRGIGSNALTLMQATKWQ